MGRRDQLTMARDFSLLCVYVSVSVCEIVHMCTVYVLLVMNIVLSVCCHTLIFTLRLYESDAEEAKQEQDW